MSIDKKSKYDYVQNKVHIENLDENTKSRY